MPEYLQTTIDKFTFRVAKDRFYASDGVWMLPAQSRLRQRVRVGVTDFFQQHNGDVAFVNVKSNGGAFRIRGGVRGDRNDEGEHKPPFSRCRNHHCG